MLLEGVWYSAKKNTQINKLSIHKLKLKPNKNPEPIKYKLKSGFRKHNFLKGVHKPW